MKGPEFYEKQAITKYLDEGKLLVWYFRPYMAGFGKSGVSDIVGCYRARAGQMFAIEVKRPGKALTAIQARRLAEIEAAGGKGFWGTAEKVIAEFEAWIA
jgi:hypothetical protein